MKAKKYFFKTNKFGFVLGAVLLAALTECVNNASGQNVNVTVTPPIAAPNVVMQDQYVYYPQYGVYYNSRRRLYVYLENGQWVTQSAPPGVSVAVLMDSPAVNMDFHDSPAKHHSDIIQKYPRNWKPAGWHQNQDRKDRNDER